MRVKFNLRSVSLNSVLQPDRTREHSALACHQSDTSKLGHPDSQNAGTRAKQGCKKYLRLSSAIVDRLLRSNHFPQQHGKPMRRFPVFGGFERWRPGVRLTTQLRVQLPLRLASQDIIRGLFNINKAIHSWRDLASLHIADSDLGVKTLTLSSISFEVRSRCPGTFSSIQSCLHLLPRKHNG